MMKVSQLQMDKSRKALIILSFSLGIPYVNKQLPYLCTIPNTPMVSAGIVSIVKITTIKSLIDAGDPTCNSPIPFRNTMAR